MSPAGAQLPNFFSFVGLLATDVGLDHIEFCDSAQRPGGQRRRSRREQVVEFSPRVRPASRFADRAIVEQGVEASVGVGLPHAFELGQVRLRMDALAVLRAGKPDCWQCGADASAVIYCLMLTCRACNIEPYAYIRHVLTELPQRATGSNITDLLPFNFTAR